MSSRDKDTDVDIDIKCDVSSEREDYFCDQCPTICESKAELARHIQKIHSVNNFFLFSRSISNMYMWKINFY